MKHFFIYILSLLCCTSIFGQQTPAPRQTETIAIKGATAHLGNGRVIENSLIVFKEGKLTLVEKFNSQNLANSKVIEATGKHVYPGLIACSSTLGLAEIDAVKASVDDSEIGDFTPHIRSLIAYNAESKVVESMRPNGVLLGQIIPKGGRLSGTSSVVQFDAWNWEDATVKENDGVYMSWPSTFSRGRWWLGEDPALKINEQYQDQIDEVEAFFNQTKAYAAGDQKIVNLAYKATQGLFDGSKTLFINVDDERGINDALHFARKNRVQKLVIVGGAEAYKLVDLLKQYQIPVIVDRVHELPNHEDADYDQPYKLAAHLTKQGLLVALNAAGDMERMNTRNLPFYAGTTVAHGLDKEEALKLITSNAAKILGIDKDYGSLEVGKSATLFISDGDALDMRSNKLSHAFIDGRDVSLKTHQTILYERYKNKYKEEGVYKAD